MMIKGVWLVNVVMVMGIPLPRFFPPKAFSAVKYLKGLTFTMILGTNQGKAFIKRTINN